VRDARRVSGLFEHGAETHALTSAAFLPDEWWRRGPTNPVPYCA
jgi:hypothetical protein